MVIDQKLRNDFIEVIRYSQNIEEPKVESLLRTWHNAKLPLMRKFFKGKTIIKLPDKVVFTLCDEAKTQRLESFVEYIANLMDSLGGWEIGRAHV